MGSSFRATRTKGDVPYKAIALAIQEYLDHFSKPINFSVLFYKDGGAGDTLSVLVAFDSRDQSDYDQPDQDLASSFDIHQPSQGLCKRILRKLRKEAPPLNISRHLSTNIAISLARRISLIFGHAEALMISDSLCEGGHVVFENGLPRTGTIVGFSGDDIRLDFKDGAVSVSSYQPNGDWGDHFFSGEPGDVEEFLEDLEFLGRIQIMKQKAAIPEDELTLEQD